jgi:hypothetical protein
LTFAAITFSDFIPHSTKKRNKRDLVLILITDLGTSVSIVNTKPSKQLSAAQPEDSLIDLIGGIK